MTALDECHARGFLYKALGNCNDIKRDVNKCLSEERWARAKRNRDQAREKRKRVEQLWADERAFERGFPPASDSSAGAGSSNTGATAAAAGEGEKR
jgi:COX assembly protein 2